MSTKLTNTFNLLFFIGMTCLFFYAAVYAIEKQPLTKQGIVKTVNGKGVNYETN